jgi:hypothetical protein
MESHEINSKQFLELRLMTSYNFENMYQCMILKNHEDRITFWKGKIFQKSKNLKISLEDLQVGCATYIGSYCVFFFVMPIAI